MVFQCACHNFWNDVLAEVHDPFEGIAQEERYVRFFGGAATVSVMQVSACKARCRRCGGTYSPLSTTAKIEGGCSMTRSTPLRVNGGMFSGAHASLDCVRVTLLWECTNVCVYIHICMYVCVFVCVYLCVYYTYTRDACYTA